MRNLSTKHRHLIAVKTTLAAAVVLLGVTVWPAAADAGVRVNARLRTPHVQIGVRSHKPHKNVYRGRAHRTTVRRPYRHAFAYPARYDYIPPRFDRRIAKRLARRTGYARRDFMHMRRDGYTWREIGRYYEIPLPVMRTAVRPFLRYTWRAQPGYVYNDTCDSFR